MGSKLTREDQDKSEDAIYDFNQRCAKHTAFKARVRVLKNDKTLLDKNDVPIHIFDRSNWWDVEIMWENIGFSRAEYKAKGLYGKYSSGYYKIQCVGNCLIINSDVGIKIEITV